MRNWLKESREKSGLSHHQVAMKCHIQRAYYTQIEGDKRTPSVEVAQRIAQVLDFNWIKFFPSKAP